MFETIFHILNEIELHNCSVYCHAQFSFKKHIPRQAIETCHPVLHKMYILFLTTRKDIFNLVAMTGGFL